RFRVHRVTVARWMRRIREILLQQTKVHLKTLLQNDLDQLDVIFGLIESQVYASFAGLSASQHST
ncbi:MAG: transcriptional regulator, partial [Myxococcota bacterium]